VNRARVTELYYISDVRNVTSIAKRGLLCHNAADGVAHVSVASEQVQARRAKVKVPNGLKLHDYVNLYFNPRNAMLYTLVKNSPPQRLCVLGLNPDPQGKVPILEIAGVVIASQNAASGPRWLSSPYGLSHLDESLVYTRDWNHPDLAEKERRSQIAQAEVLVPHNLDFGYVACVYVTCADTEIEIKRTGVLSSVKVVPDIFFGYVKR